MLLDEFLWLNVVQFRPYSFVWFACH